MSLGFFRKILIIFFLNSSELEVGELQHVFLFGLFEAMSAIEMMDPKMDAGMKRLEEPAPMTFERAVETNFIKLEEISYADLIGLIDAMYSCLISWLEGHSLAQTVLTCLYLHKVDAIKDKTMHAICCAILKLIDLILKQIVVVKVYEEEDFQYSTYGFDLCTGMQHTDVLMMLKKAEDELIRISKQTEEPPEVILGVNARLRFTRFFLQVLTILEPKMGSETTEAEMNEITKLLSAAMELIPLIRRTIPLGTPTDAPESDAPCRIGFSLMVNQRLLPPTFPRFTKFRDRTSCIHFLEELVQRLKLAARVIHCHTYHSALTFFLDFSKRAGHCLLSRSVLQHLYFRDAPYSNKVFGRIQIDEMLRDSIRDFIAPAVLVPEHPLSNDQKARGCVKAFLFFNHAPFSSFLEICGYNRARQRDKLAKLLDSFANLQEEAEKVDAYFYKALKETETPQHLACFGTWVLYYTLRAMSLYLLSGLELELYSIHEYSYIFWYLYEFLFGWLVSSLTRAEWYLEASDSSSSSTKKTSSGGTGTGTGGSGTGKNKNSKSKNKKIRYHTVEIMYNQALQNMCGGYYKCLAGFLKEERIPQPLPMFNNERVRYEHRFLPFADLTTPPPMPYYEFKRMEHQLLKAHAADLFAAAAKHFHQARTILETIPNPDAEMNDILKVAKFNFVVMNLLANGHKKDSKVTPEFDFSIHKYYPIIKQQ